MSKAVEKQTDWEALCRHPGIIFLQRMVLVITAPIGVAAVLWMASTFLDMRDAMRDNSKVLVQFEKVLGDHETRLRDLEHFGSMTPGRK